MKTNKLLILLAAALMSTLAYAGVRDENPTPVHRPLMEEYTGTWCGWCVRGLVGMELLRDTYGDEFIGVAYHNSDAMQIMASNAYPNSVSGFPDAYIDRTSEVDPFYGFGSASAGILNAMQQFAAQAAIADLDVTAQWTSEDKTEITVNVNGYFTTDATNAKYAYEFMLIADDLYGTGSQWNQVNYYSGYNAYAGDRFLGPWVKLGSPVSGIHFNDVLIGTSKPITGSLPTTITAYENYDYSYTFKLANLPKPALVQNKDNLHVIVIIVNTQNKRAVNANRCYIDDWTSPIVLGDVTGNGVIDISDVTTLIAYLLNGDSEGVNFENSDLDGDGMISISDVTRLIAILLGGENIDPE